MSPQGRGSAGRLHPEFRLRRQVEYPDIGGRVQDRGVAVDYEVLQVSNGNALVWLEKSSAELPHTASGGFGWIEPVSRSSVGPVDSSKLRRVIEERVRTHLQTNMEASPTGSRNTQACCS